MLFLYTALSKIADHKNFIKTMRKSELIGHYAKIIAWAVPAIELIAVALLFFPKTRQKGLYLSLGLIVVFTAYIVYMLTFASKLICQCGGVLYRLSWTEHLVFNIALTLLAIAAIWLRHKQIKNIDHPLANT
jgi:hypothetical protein